jgi:hypothetical protein
VIYSAIGKDPKTRRTDSRAVRYYSFQSSRAATILYHRKQIAEAMYYYQFQSSRAATILYHLKQTAEAMYYNPSQSSRAATILWGRLATCGRLAIGLPVARATLDERLRSLRLAAMYYNSFQSSRAATILYHRKQIAEAMWGGLAKPAADCQNRPAATTRKAPGANGCRLRPAAMRGRLATQCHLLCRK